MFTGIVQSIGSVRSIQQEPSVTRLALHAPHLPRPIALGASVAVSGVCLTVTSESANLLTFDVVPETLSQTTLGQARVGTRVNLEPSLRLGDPMDGHIVQGHVDGTATVRRIDTQDHDHVIIFEAAEHLMPYIIPKGSIAIDGVSLTVAAVPAPQEFTVALIPTTLAITTLGDLKPGDAVNIESDILARTVVTTLRRWQNFDAGLDQTMTALRENGW